MVVASKASRHAEMRAKPMTVAYPERRLTPRVGEPDIARAGANRVQNSGM
jgi:hypothetical protein